MRRITQTTPSFSATRALIAGAALFAGAAAHAQSAAPTGGDETAMSIPRVMLPGGNPGVALPQPLDPSDAVRIRRIFAWQQSGNIAAAERATAELGDPLLIGDILADRYLGRFHRATADALTEWLRSYPDLPDGPAIHALLLRRLPKGSNAPAAPRLDALAPVRLDDPTPSDIDPPDRDFGHQHALLLARQARALFTSNRDREAAHTASGFISGLAAWRLGWIGLAQTRFEDAANAADTPASLRAAAAFWAARTNLRTGHYAGYLAWLQQAAALPATFYCLIANHLLGLDAGGASGRGLATEADVEAIAATPQGWRAFALLQVDQPKRAEAELRLLWPAVRDNPPLRRSLQVIAAGTGLTDLAAQLAAPADVVAGRSRSGTHDPLPRLLPAGGFRVDPAMVYALARLESNFDTTAVSAAGARGLMQLMPVTARYLSSNASLGGGQLHDPSLNLDLGQRYVVFLARQDAINGDLIRLLASYNAGLGGFLRLCDHVRDHDDPLLFIEAIPNEETRAFVQRALAYMWIYAARLGLAAPSLSELAAGQFPRFTPRAPEGKLAAVAPRLH